MQSARAPRQTSRRGPPESGMCACSMSVSCPLSTGGPFRPAQLATNPCQPASLLEGTLSARAVRVSSMTVSRVPVFPACSGCLSFADALCAPVFKPWLLGVASHLTRVRHADLRNKERWAQAPEVQKCYPSIQPSFHSLHVALQVSLMPLNEFFCGSGFRRPRPADQAGRGRHPDLHRCGSGVGRHLVKHGG